MPALRAAIGTLAVYRARGPENDSGYAVFPVRQVVEQRGRTADIGLRVTRNLVHGLRRTGLRRQVDDVANVRQDFLPVGWLPDVTAIDFDRGVFDQPARRDLGHRPMGLRAEVVE